MHLLLLIHVHIHTHICTHSFSSIIQVDVLVAVRNADVALDADDVIEMHAKKKARKTIAGMEFLLWPQPVYIKRLVRNLIVNCVFPPLIILINILTRLCLHARVVYPNNNQ